MIPDQLKMLHRLRMAGEIISGHVQSMRLRKRLTENAQVFFVNDIKHLTLKSDAGLEANKGQISVPLNNTDARDDFTLLYEEYVGAQGWYKPMDLLDAKRTAREEQLRADLEKLDQEKDKQAYADLTARLNNHQKAREKYAQLAAGTFQAKGTNGEEMNEMFKIAQERKALAYIEEHHPEALAPFVVEETFAGIKAVGDLGVNLAMDFVPILKRADGKYAFILGDRPDKIFKCTIGGMDEGNVVVTLLKEITEELCSKDLFAADSASLKALAAKKLPAKDFAAFLSSVIGEKGIVDYGLQDYFANAESADATILLSNVITHLEKVDATSPQAHAAHELATKIKVEVDKKYFEAENNRLKQYLLSRLRAQPIRAQVGDDRSGPCAVMRTVPFFGLFDAQELEKELALAHKTMSGGDDLAKPSITNIDEVDFDGLFAEHAAILVESLAWLYEQQAQAGQVDPVLVEQIQAIEKKNPKILGILELCNNYTETHRKGVGNLFSELSASVKFLLAYQAISEKGDLPELNVQAAIETLNLYLWNRDLKVSNDEVKAPMTFEEAVNQVVAQVKQLKGQLTIRADEWPTRKQLGQVVAVKLVTQQLSEAQQKLVAPQGLQQENAKLKDQVSALQEQTAQLMQQLQEAKKHAIFEPQQQQQNNQSSSSNTRRSFTSKAAGVGDDGLTDPLLNTQKDNLEPTTNTKNSNCCFM